MHRRPIELKHLKRKSRSHSAKSQHSGRTKMGVTYKDLSPEEYEQARWKCGCKRCQDGKQHKHKRSSPTQEEHPQDIFDDILLDKNIDEFDRHYWDYDENCPYEGCTLEDAEEWGFCLPEDYDNQGKYQWPNGSSFKDDEDQ